MLEKPDIRQSGSSHPLSTPATWKLVPVEPTPDMLDAITAWAKFPVNAYAAMLSASPSPEALPASGVEAQLRAALQLAKDMFIANNLSLPHTFEVIDRALASDASPAPTSGSEDGGDWDSLTVHEKAVRSAWNYMQSPFSYSDDEKRFVFELLDEALAKPASEPAGGAAKRPHGEIMDELDHAHRLAQETPEGCITSAELIRRCGGDPTAPFERGLFPPEMRQFPGSKPQTWRDLDDDRLKLAVDAFYLPCEGTTIDGVHAAILAWEQSR